MNTRGQLDLDLLSVLALLVMIGFASYVSYLTLTKWQDQNSDNFDATTNGILNDTADALKLFDGIMAVVMGFIIMILIWSATRLSASAIFLPIAIVTVVVMVFISGQVSNMFDVFINDTTVSGVTSSLPVQTNILRNSPFFVGLIGVILIIATFSSIGGDQRA